MRIEEKEMENFLRNEIGIVFEIGTELSTGFASETDGKYYLVLIEIAKARCIP